MADRLEEMLPDALRRHAGDDVGVAGLAAGARARAARRGRRRTVGVVAAAALAVAAVPAAIALTGSSPSVEPAPSPTTTSDATPAPSDWRVESWRNLTVEVPEDWGYGGGPGWCAVDGTGNRPEVGRPGAGGRDILCSSEMSYGLHFIDASAIRWARESGDVWQYGWDSPNQVKAYPENAWLGLFRVDDHALMAVTRDESTAREVVDSAREVTASDPNGCAPRESSLEPLGVGERWSVCRYSGDGWLVQSELLSEADSAAFRDAIASAPLDTGGPACAQPGPPPGFVLAGSGEDLGTARVQFERPCPQGVSLSGTVRELTPDVLYWALSPGWSGGADGSVPLPDVLRRN